MKKRIAAAIVLASAFFSAPSFAFDVSDFNAYASLGYEFGGERYTKVTYVDSGITDNAYANEGWLVSLGASIANNAAQTFETQLAIGIKFGGPSGDKSGVYWNSIPIEVIEYYRSGNWRTGLGLTYQVNSHVVAQSVNEAAETFHLNNALGYLASTTYSPVGQNYAMELRYTYLKQAPADFPDEKLKASSFGAFLHYRF
jgi:hypothetical protein